MYAFNNLRQQKHDKEADKQEKQQHRNDRACDAQGSKGFVGGCFFTPSPQLKGAVLHQAHRRIEDICQDEAINNGGQNGEKRSDAVADDIESEKQEIDKQCGCQNRECHHGNSFVFKRVGNFFHVDLKKNMVSGIERPDIAGMKPEMVTFGIYSMKFDTLNRQEIICACRGVQPLKRTKYYASLDKCGISPAAHYGGR